MLATSRHTEAALQSYDTVLRTASCRLECSLGQMERTSRSGQVEAVTELQRIAGIDPRNPLIFYGWRGNSASWTDWKTPSRPTTHAVELGPDMLNWRLALARARFDILDYEGAERDVFVLERVTPGSPLELSAGICSRSFWLDGTGRRFPGR